MALRSQTSQHRCRSECFARLYLLKPFVFAVLALFWIGTAAIALGPGWRIGLGLMYEGGIAEPLASWVVIAGALADL